MSNKPKTAAEHRAKTNINYKKLVKRFIAKPVAYVTLFILASYGLRQMLKTINDTASLVLVVLLVLALAYILFLDD